MMSLIEVSPFDIVKKQYFFKLRSYLRIFSSMVILQLIAILFSFGGTGSSGGESNNVAYNFSYYSANTVLMFTFLWALISSILITTKANRYNDFTFVTNRTISHLSNFLILLTASIIGGITAFLSNFLLKVIVYYFVNNQVVNSVYLPTEIVIGIVTTILYVLLFCAIGYLIGTLIQLHKIFVVLIPGLLIGSELWNSRSEKGTIMEILTEIFTTETSLFLFIIKIILTSSLLLICSIVISNRLEVRQ